MPTMQLASCLQTFHKCKIEKQMLWLLVDGAVFSCAVHRQPDDPLCSTDYRDANINIDAYASLLQVSIDNRALKEGKVLHAHILVGGLNHNADLERKLVTMYAICGSMVDARLIFNKISEKDAFVWNVMIRGYACKGFCEEALTLYHQMQRAGIEPDNFTFPFALKACASLLSLQEGKEIHYHVVRTGFQFDAFVATALIDMYSKCGAVEIARQLFDKMPSKGAASWNAMIAGYTQNGYAREALALFHQMLLSDLKPNRVTVVSVLPACADLSNLQQGKDIHEYIMKNRFESDLNVGNSLVAMYARCGNLEVARQLFDKMSKRNVVSWNTMIAGYAQNGHASEALALFQKMQLFNVTPDRATIVSMLPACADLGALQQGKGIHQYIVKSRLELDVSVASSLVAMYAKCGSVVVARQLFDKVPKRDVVLWNTMIAGYAQNGHANEALTLFHQMQFADMKPDSFTMVSVIPACAHLAALQPGKVTHAYIIRNGFDSGIVVVTALIDMYSKCGSVKIARQLFDKMPEKNVVSWSVMIAGYGMHGHGEDALLLFSLMQQTGMKPDYITFTSVLCACSHAGLVDEGWQFFECMSQDHCLTPRADHYACMVDLLGRAGHLDEAYEFVKRMPLEPNANVWGALLGACRTHCNIELGEHVAERLFDLEPKDAGNYVLLSNIYAAAGRWDDVERVRTMMKDRGVTKIPGCSLIEINERVHTFLAGDRSHPQFEQIYAMVEVLTRQMEAAGYVPNVNSVLQNVTEEVKKQMLCSHSEKLAIAFGLINTSPGTAIRITKNLRVCDDCHSATKFISKIVQREFIVRDANRFHHFKDGLCSCGDYW